MTRRRHLLLALAAVVALMGSVYLLWPRSAITEENAAKIQPGMSMAEVEEILGGPARDETGGRGRRWPDGSRFFDDPNGDSYEWIGSEHAVAVWVFDGHVTRREFCRVVLPRGESLVNRLRRALRL